MRGFAAISLALFIVAPQSATNAQTGEPGAAKPVKEKRVCRRETPTGSRLAIRTCRTAAEWEAIDRENATQADREVDRIQTMSKGGGSGYSPN
jgi:hypothetical protein